MNVFKSNSRITKNKNIMKFQLHTNASKKIDDYWLYHLNDLFGIKLIF